MPTALINPKIIKLKDSFGPYEEEIYALYIDGQIIDQSYSLQYLRQLAWDAGVADYDIVITRKELAA